MFKCAECGLIFDESEIAIWEEYLGERHGFPVYEKLSGCPRCKSGDIKEIEVDEERGE